MVIHLACVLVLLCTSAGAETLIVLHDIGGPLQERLDEIEHLRAVGAKVRITGTCNSACTLYLGLPDACVTESALLGFHGPTSQFYGVGLTPDDFEHWSAVMADHYPPAMSRWFMQTGREVTLGLISISGNQAVRMGARMCGKME